MGFFRRLFRRKRPKSNTSPAAAEENTSSLQKLGGASTSSAAAQEWAGLDANKHAIAVAAATAAVAEAALAAARAAAEVVRLTNSAAPGTYAHVSLPVAAAAPPSATVYLAAVKIQSAFRRYLARRALRALKALVKLQALVRGHIVRKQSADMLRRMQTLVRLQTRACVSRSLMSESPHSSSKSSLCHHPLPESPDKIGYQQRAYSSKFEGPSALQRCGSNSNVRDAIILDKRRLATGWLDRWMEESAWNNRRDASLRYEQVHDMKGDKILEVDTWKPHLVSQRRPLTFETAQHVVASSDHYTPSFVSFNSPTKHSIKEPNPIPSQASMDVFSLSSLRYPIAAYEAAFRTAEISPQAFSASSRPGSCAGRGHPPFTQARSECSWGLLNAYASHPNYMANTESFRAKVRSQSAPRQRLEFEKYGLTKKSIQELWDAGTSSDNGFAQDADFRNKASISSSRLDRLGGANPR